MQKLIQTSDEFKKSVYAPSRMTKAKVRFEILDTEAFKDNTKAATGEALISRLNQVTNKIRKMDNKYAVFEKNYFKLDGSFILPPRSNEMINSELGWWSNTLCNDEGFFDPYQVLEFNFTKEHSSMGLTLYFDILNEECASDFDIDIFDQSGNTIKHESIINNKDFRYIYICQLAGYTKIIITIKKWCKPYRRAKVVEVDFGIIKEYEDNTLINMNLIQELDLTSSTLPADEFKFTVDNSNKEFNVLNPQGFYAFLQQGQEVFTEIGVELDSGEVEFIQVGKYYLKDCQSDEGALTTTFTARDLLDSLSNDEIESSTVRDITLYDMAVEVMEASGIEDYVLSDNLKLIHTNGLYQKISYRNLLQLIAVAGMCIVYTDSFGTLHMKQLVSAKTVIDSVDVTSEASSISNKDQVINNVINPSFKVATFEKSRFKLDGSFSIPSEDMSSYEVGWLSGELCDSDGAFQNEQVLTINLLKEHSSTNLQVLFDTLNNEYAQQFSIRAYDANDNLIINEAIVNGSSQFSYQNNSLASSRKIEVAISKWSRGIGRAKISETGFDLPVGNITFDNVYSKPKITLSQAVKAVEVTYYPTDLNTKAIYTAYNTDLKDGATLKVNNSLINTEADAINVAEWILKENDQIATFAVDWRQNPSLSLADTIAIENGYGTNHIVTITKQEYNYEGYLNGKTEAKGVI